MRECNDNFGCDRYLWDVSKLEHTNLWFVCHRESWAAAAICCCCWVDEAVSLFFDVNRALDVLHSLHLLHIRTNHYFNNDIYKIVDTVSKRNFRIFLRFGTLLVD